MAVVTLPVDEDSPWYSFVCALDGVSYTFEMQYNLRSGRWVLSIADVVGTPIVASVPILIERDLLSAYRHLPVPQGYLLALDNSGQHQEPSLGSFLRDHVLLYVEAGT